MNHIIRSLPLMLRTNEDKNRVYVVLCGRTNTPKAFNNIAEGRAQRTLGKQP